MKSYEFETEGSIRDAQGALEQGKEYLLSVKVIGAAYFAADSANVFVEIPDGSRIWVDEKWLRSFEENEAEEMKKEMNFKLLDSLIGVKMESLKDSIKEIVESGKKEELLSEAIQFEEFYGNLLWQRAEIDILIEKNRRKHIKAGLVALTLRFMEQKHE